MRTILMSVWWLVTFEMFPLTRRARAFRLQQGLWVRLPLERRVVPAFEPESCPSRVVAFQRRWTLRQQQRLLQLRQLLRLRVILMSVWRQELPMSALFPQARLAQVFQLRRQELLMVAELFPQARLAQARLLPSLRQRQGRQPVPAPAVAACRRADWSISRVGWSARPFRPSFPLTPRARRPGRGCPPPARK
jgi:hypothetical protein